MTRQRKIWWWAAALFTLVNLGGAVYAAMRGEVIHADVHGALFFLGLYLVRRLRGTVGRESEIPSGV